MSTRFFAAAMVAAFSLTACQGSPTTGNQAAAAAKGSGIIKGTVTTSGVVAASGGHLRILQAANMAVPGAHIEVTGGGFNTEARANVDGSFNVSVPGGATYTVTASHSDGQGGMMKQVAVVEVPLADDPPIVDVASLVTRRTGSIQGVIALSDGADPEGADVFVPGTTIVGKVSAKGRFALANLPEGTWNIVIQKPGYQRGGMLDLSVQAGKPLVLNDAITLTKGETEGGSVSALVRDGAGKAIVGATYSIVSETGISYTAVSDGQGAVKITGLPAGAYRAQVYRPFYQVPLPSFVDVAANQATDAGTVTLKSTVLQFGQIKGQLLDESGAPVDGAVVQLDPPTTEQVFTDSQGRFTLDRVMPGEYTMRASAGGFETIERNVLVDNLPGFVADLDGGLVMRAPFDPAKPHSDTRPAIDVLPPQVKMTKQGADLLLTWDPVGVPSFVKAIAYDVDVEVLPNVYFPLTTTGKTSVTLPGMGALPATLRVTAKPVNLNASAGYRINQLSVGGPGVGPMGAPVLDRATEQQLSARGMTQANIDTLKQTLTQNVVTNASTADIFAFLTQFQKMAQEMRSTARSDREASLNAQVAQLNQAATTIRNAAETRLNQAVLQGAMQIAGGAIQMAGATSLTRGAVLSGKLPSQDTVMQLQQLQAKTADLNMSLSGIKSAQTGAWTSAVNTLGSGTGVGSVVAGAYAKETEANKAKLAEAEAQARALASQQQQAQDMMNQMMNVIRDVRDKLAAIQQSAIETNKGIARNI